MCRVSLTKKKEKKYYNQMRLWSTLAGKTIQKSKIYSRMRLWWILVGKPSKGRKFIIEADFGGLLRASHPKVEKFYNQRRLWWALAG